MIFLIILNKKKIKVRLKNKILNLNYINNIYIFYKKNNKNQNILIKNKLNYNKKK